RFDRAQVFAHDHRLGAGALQGEDVEQLLVWIANICAAGGSLPGGNPELAEEAHHMIDAKRTSWRHLRPQRFDERPVTSLAEPVGDEGREAPVLAESVELVRRGADTH